jgi:hypothetical protein
VGYRIRGIPEALLHIFPIYSGRDSCILRCCFDWHEEVLKARVSSWLNSKEKPALTDYLYFPPANRIRLPRSKAIGLTGLGPLEIYVADQFGKDWSKKEEKNNYDYE